MKKSILSIGLLALIFSMNTYAEKALHAHEHGSIKLGFAVEKKTAELDLDGPTESFISFEYLPKTAKEKKIFSDAENLWNKKLLTLISLDPSLGCQISTSSFKQVIDEAETKEAQAKIKDAKKKEEGVHSDIEAKATISCQKELVGTNATINLKKYFKNIKKLVVDVISNETKSVTISKDSEVIKL
jgi:hypothetical protein